MNMMSLIPKNVLANYCFAELEQHEYLNWSIQTLFNIYCQCCGSIKTRIDEYSEIKCFEELKLNQIENKLKRKMEISSICLIKNLHTLIKCIQRVEDNNEVVFLGKQKSSNRANASAKRTSYFGVSKNGPNWQTLISINKKKTYVGTFMTEREAGEAYDFYSMLLHGSKALTNFTYSKLQVENLINNYRWLVDRDY